MRELIWMVIQHSNLTQRERIQIAELKNQHWPYGIESQLKWMDRNIENSDLHLLGVDKDKKIIAYITLVSLIFSIDGKDAKGLGVGGVCVDKTIEKKGFGKKLVFEANDIINQKGEVGLLLCKDELINFYKKCGWQEVFFSSAIVDREIYKYNVMSFPKCIECESISINRNF